MKPYTLTDRAGESISPMTSTRTVFDENGVDLDTLLARQKSDTEAALKEYPKKTEVSQALADKQDALSTTTDLHITDDNIIGLTEAAKMKLFVDLWNEACGKWGKYDPDNATDPEHPFYLNELWLTYEEATATYEAGAIDQIFIILRYYGMKIRTNIPMKCGAWASGSSTDAKFRISGVVNGSDIEVLNLSTRGPFNLTIKAEPDNSVGIVSFLSKKLRKILGVIDCTHYSGNGRHKLFGECPALESVSLSLLNAGLDLSECPMLNAASFSYMIANRYPVSRGGRDFTLTVHADVYAKLTDETNAEWYAVLVAAEKKNITFATV